MTCVTIDDPRVSGSCHLSGLAEPSGPHSGDHEVAGSVDPHIEAITLRARTIRAHPVPERSLIGICPSGIDFVTVLRSVVTV
ncbi:hypothetical protein GCM10025787_26570 [Saccharopolyspora rosea]